MKNLNNIAVNSETDGESAKDSSEDFIKINARKILRTTSKAVLILNDKGQAWIPLSLIIKHNHKPNKKNPWRFKVKSFFKISYEKSNVFDEA